MKYAKQVTSAFVIVLMTLGMNAPAFAQHAGHDAAAMHAPDKFVQTDAALRDLWIGHVFWVRNVVVDTFAGNTAATTVAQDEVVANAHQIAAAIEPFYGKAASDKLFNLLAGHYGAVKQYLDATVANSKSNQDAAMKKLTDNAGEIASFLAGANPNLPVDTLRSLLLAHGAHHVQQIQQLHDKQFAQEARTWEMMKNHMYVIADALTSGLAKQFPDKFRTM